MAAIIRQQFCIPKPTLHDKNCPDQSGRVFIITGGYAGVGCEFSHILYAANATVYIAGRSKAKASSAMERIQKAIPKSKGHLHFLQLDLSNLSTIKPAVDSFLTSEPHLHVLVNNAGVMFPPQDSVNAQGIELQIGTNCLGHFLLHKLLMPILSTTAAQSPTGSVRVTWAGSMGLHLLSPKDGGMDLDDQGKPKDHGPQGNYGQSKVGNLYFARHYARQTQETGVVHACFNPGNLRTELQRHSDGLGLKIANALLLEPAIYGAYTELWAALSPEITPQKSGAYVWPWGRFGTFRDDIELAMRLPSEGGTGVAARFVDWCEEVCAPYT